MLIVNFIRPSNSLIAVIGEELAEAISAIFSSSLTAVIGEKLGTTISSIYISSCDLTRAVDLALLLYAISSEILN